MLNIAFGKNVKSETKARVIEGMLDRIHGKTLQETKEKAATTQINFYQATNELINENAKKLIDISPKTVVKSGIEGII